MAQKPPPRKRPTGRARADTRTPARGRRRPARHNRLTWWLAAGGVAIVLVVAAVATAGGGASGSTTPSAFDLPALGREGRVRLADFRGKPVVVNFFASWCDACKFELPGFAAAADKLRGEVTFVGVNSLETGNGMRMARDFKLLESGFVLAKDINGQQASGLHDALGGRGMPITVFYDSRGQLVDFAGGALPDDVLRQKLNQLYGVDV